MTSAPPRSNCAGCGSWQKTTTSCTARLHSRASARVYTFEPVPPSRYPCQMRMRTAKVSLGQMEVQRVQQLDRRVRGVHRHVRRRLEERLGVVDDDLHAGCDEL